MGRYDDDTIAAAPRPRPKVISFLHVSLGSIGVPPVNPAPTTDCGVEQLRSAHWAHNPEVVGSNPTPATVSIPAPSALPFSRRRGLLPTRRFGALLMSPRTAAALCCKDAATAPRRGRRRGSAVATLLINVWRRVAAPLLRSRRRAHARTSAPCPTAPYLSDGPDGAEQHLLVVTGPGGAFLKPTFAE